MSDGKWGGRWRLWGNKRMGWIQGRLRKRRWGRMISWLCSLFEMAWWIASPQVCYTRDAPLRDVEWRMVNVNRQLRTAQDDHCHFYLPLLSVVSYMVFLFVFSDVIMVNSICPSSRRKDLDTKDTWRAHGHSSPSAHRLRSILLFRRWPCWTDDGGKIFQKQYSTHPANLLSHLPHPSVCKNCVNDPIYDFLPTRMR